MVYVDGVEIPFKGKIMCHMIADSTEELNEMADLIGLNRSWIQNPGSLFEHYDVSLGKKRIAIENGAKEIKATDIREIMQKKIDKRTLSK